MQGNPVGRRDAEHASHCAAKAGSEAEGELGVPEWAPK